MKLNLCVGNSISAMVATVLPRFTKYFCTTSTFNAKRDLVQNIGTDLATKCNVFVVNLFYIV